MEDGMERLASSNFGTSYTPIVASLCLSPLSPTEVASAEPSFPPLVTFRLQSKNLDFRSPSKRKGGETYHQHFLLHPLKQQRTPSKRRPLCTRDETAPIFAVSPQQKEPFYVYDRIAPPYEESKERAL